MSTWIVLDFPIPPGMGNAYKFGLVTAATEAAAKQLVLDQLEILGLDLTDITIDAVLLQLWWSIDTPFGKTHLHFG